VQLISYCASEGECKPRSSAGLRGGTAVIAQLCHPHHTLQLEQPVSCVDQSASQQSKNDTANTASSTTWPFFIQATQNCSQSHSQRHSISRCITCTHDGLVKKRRAGSRLRQQVDQASGGLARGGQEEFVHLPAATLLVPEIALRVH